MKKSKSLFKSLIDAIKFMLPDYSHFENVNGVQKIYRKKVEKPDWLKLELQLKAINKREMRASKLQHNHHKGELLNYYNA